MGARLTKESINQLVLMLCCGALLAAWTAEYVFGIAACTLCLYQRYLYILAITIISVDLFLLGNRNRTLFAILATLILLTNSGVAGYQVAVENKWLPLPEICKAPPLGNTFEEFQAMVTSKPHVSCDKMTWRLFGISMAGYNALFALMLGIISFLGVMAHDDKKKKFARR